MMTAALTIYDIPTEILISVLSKFPTHDLLPLTLVSHRFHNLILRILHFRLLLAASNPAYQIILEAYLPSRRFTRPYLFCTYLGTNGLSSHVEGKGSLYEDIEGVGGKLGRLGALYSRFRPEVPAVSGTMPIRRIAGAAPNLQSNNGGLGLDWFNSTPGAGPNTSVEGALQSMDVDTVAQNVGAAAQVETSIESSIQSTSTQPQIPDPIQSPPQSSTSQPIWANGGDGGSRKPVYTLHLDEGELFVQFCAAATLVRLGPRRGVFLSYVPIVEDKRGVIRVWRHWLLDRVRNMVDERLTGGDGGKLERTSTDLRSEDIVKDKNVLWTDARRNIGLKLGIKERNVGSECGVSTRDRLQEDDDAALSFDIEIRELIVRTTNLLLAVEESQELQNQPGKALVFDFTGVTASDR